MKYYAFISIKTNGKTFFIFSNYKYAQRKIENIRKLHEISGISRDKNINELIKNITEWNSIEIEVVELKIMELADAKKHIEELTKLIK